MRETGNMVYILPGNRARRPMQASSITPPLRGSRRDKGEARSRSGGGPTRRPVRADQRHSQSHQAKRSSSNGARCRKAAPASGPPPHQPSPFGSASATPPPQPTHAGGYRDGAQDLAFGSPCANPPPHQPSPFGSTSVQAEHGLHSKPETWFTRLVFLCGA